jgi:hypothetical protein
VSSDIVTINGKTFTRSRALAQGLIDAKGEVTAKADSLFGGNREKTSQPVKNRDRKAAREAIEPETTSDGKLVARKKVEPLKPKNVKDGKPIEDEEELAKIAAKTAEIEAAAKAEREAAAAAG